MSEVFASGKVVFREECTEGSQTAKSGTDEQKRDMRHGYSDKQASRGFGITPQEYKHRFVVDHAGIGGREKLLPGDALTTTGLVKSRSQQRS